MAGYDRLTNEGRAFFKQIKELEKLQVRVGYQHGKETHEESGADIADIAMWNEVGTSRSPARPFMRNSVDNNADKINAMCKAQLNKIATGSSTAQDVLNALGVMQKGLIQSEIVNGTFVPNAPSTIKRKKSDKPLINTGRMRQSVSYVIVPK